LDSNSKNKKWSLFFENDQCNEINNSWDIINSSEQEQYMSSLCTILCTIFSKPEKEVDIVQFKLNH